MVYPRGRRRLAHLEADCSHFCQTALRGLLLVYSYSPLAYAVLGSPKHEYGENMRTHKKPLQLRGWVLLLVLVAIALLIGVLRPKLAF